MNEEVVRKIHDTNKNLIINGDISIGKTKNVGFPLVNNIIESKESFLILDSKEEYLTKYYDSLKEKDYNIIIINLRDFNKSEGWNCLEYPYQLYKKGETDKALDYLESIGKELFYEKNSTDPFWNNAASDLFTGIALGLFQDANPEEINFCSINHLLSANDIKTATSNELTEYFRTKEKTNPAYISASEAVFAPTETREGIISVAKQKLKMIASRELLCNLLSRTTFKLKDITETKTAIFLIAKDEDTNLNSLASIFIKQLYFILTDNKCENKFHFFLDNFDSIPSLDGLIGILSSCISRNIKTTLITRSIDELETKYGRYIKKLSMEINVDEKNITIQTNEGVQKIKNILTDTLVQDTIINYPKRKNKPIQLFDYKNVTNHQKFKKFENKLEEYSNNNSDPFKIDDLLKRLDGKIKELEKEEIKEMKLLAEKDTSLKSDLLQFKLHDNDD